jgi:hypothetical protein
MLLHDFAASAMPAFHMHYLFSSGASTNISQLLLLLLLLWAIEKKPGRGAGKSTRKDTWQGHVQHKFKQGMQQYESTGACSTHEHAVWCCRDCLVLWKCSSMPH